MTARFVALVAGIFFFFLLHHHRDVFKDFHTCLDIIRNHRERICRRL